jgi:hypothetical protein
LLGASVAVVRAEEPRAVACSKAEADRPDGALLALSASEMQRLRKLYFVLRKSAFDTCQAPGRNRNWGDNLVWCVESELQRLVNNAGNTALTEHHGYISQIREEYWQRPVVRHPGGEDALW